VQGTSTERTPALTHRLPNAKYFGFDCEEPVFKGESQISVARKIGPDIKIQRRRAASASTGLCAAESKDLGFKCAGGLTATGRTEKWPLLKLAPTEDWHPLTLSLTRTH
jgi:hypothetical protein